MPKFRVQVKVREYYDKKAIFDVDAENEEDAKGTALKFVKSNSSDITWASILLTKRPRFVVDSVSLAEDESSPEE